MRLFLVVQNEGKQKGMKIPAAVMPFLVGRDPECQLRPASTVISKKHCCFSREGDLFFLEDFESTNGTFLRGEKIFGKVPILSGERVQIGPLEFDVLIEVGVLVNAAPPAPSAAVAPAVQTAVKPPISAQIKPDSVIPPKPKNPATTKAVEAKADPAPAVSVPLSNNALDDDIAALLLGGDGGGSGEYPSAGDGTTIIDLNGDTNPSFPVEGKPGEPNKPGVGAPPIVNSTDAAKSLLDKYMRRSRTTS